MSQDPKTEDSYLDAIYELAGRRIDPIAGIATVGDQRVALNRKLLEVLACLAEAGVEMVAREQFIARAWRGNALVGESGLTHAVHSLRRALQDTDSSKPLIRTIPRRGYQLTVRARLLDGNATAAFAPGMPIAGKPGWQLSRRLGGNAVSETWLAQDDVRGEQRVFRFCRSERHLQALRRETKVLRYLREALGARKDMAVVIDWQLQEPPYHVEMDYAAGGSLADWAATQGGIGRIPMSERLRLAGEVATGLAAVHAAGVVHRNVGPTSILIDDPGEGHATHARLAEFGLSELADRSRLDALDITRSGLTLTGNEADAETPLLAPERLAGEAATTASDVHALGMILLQLAVGDLQRSPDAVPDDKIDSDELRALIAACLNARPEDRPAAAAVSERLCAIAGSIGGDAPSAPEAGTAPAVAAVDTTKSMIGRTIGPYRLVDQLGEGGMGIVYLAEQQAPVQRKVALKVVRTGLMSADVRARFEAERQALALMNHANVAAVYDAGNTPSGQPYFAMEYVQGQEITAHCDRLKLDVRARIALFLQVCEGTLHAHQKGLIHRDIKPGNILVSRAKDQPASVKIIDFGVAKSISGILAAQPAHTRLGCFVGTPAYSSPEQVSGPVASVDTRSDIYSLGVVLYELLAGVTPYNEEELNRKTPVELARLLSGEHSPMPLVRFASLGREEESRIASLRSLSVEQLKALLDTDLSWIVGKCLEVDPDDRYATVLALETDLRRWLEDKPVQARPASRLYRMRKFVRRHRLGVAAASLGTLALLTTTGAAVYGYIRAERALETAEKAAEFQVKQIQGLDPARMGLGLRDTLREAVRKHGADQGLDTAEVASNLQRLDGMIEGLDFTSLAVDQLDNYSLKPALAAINNDYRDHPLLQAQLWQTMADTLDKLGKFEEALEPQRLAVEQRRRLLGPDHPQTLRSLIRRASLYSVLRRYELAEADIGVALQAARRSLGDDDPITLEALLELSGLTYHKGDPEKAKKIQLQAVAKLRNKLGDDHPLTLRSVRSLVAMLVVTDEPKEAIRLGQEALKRHRRIMGQSAETLDMIEYVAMAYLEDGKMEQAESLTRDAIEGSRRLFGDAHERTLGKICNASLILMENGRYDDAEAILRNAIRDALPIYGEETEIVANLKRNLGLVFMRQGRFAESESIYMKLSVIDRKLLGEDHPETNKGLSKAAMSMAHQGMFDEAETLFRKVLDSRRRTLGDSHRNTLGTTMYLANVLMLKGDLDAAEALDKPTLDAVRRVHGDDDPLTLSAISEMGAIAHARSDREQAENLLRKALAGQRSVKGITDAEEMLITLDRLVLVLRERGATEETAALGAELIETALRIHPQTHYLLGKYMTNHARTLIELRRFEEAERVLERARANLAQGTNRNPRPVRALIEAYATLYDRWNTTRPGAGLDRKAAFWRGKLDAMEAIGDDRAAAVLSGTDLATH
ncbi:MAG: tetratricopeptide repeat protein [Pseudomonadota bacterium]